MDVNVIIESHIPYTHGVLERLGASVRYLPPEAITPESVRDADAIVTRTRTRCDANLLQNSRCQVIATATIGLDHIDLPWCESHGIKVINAPGCNAPAVAQYLFGSLATIVGADLPDMTLGVVGVGNVGRIVARWGESLGMKVLLNDPPRSRAEGSTEFCSLDYIAKNADIITFHTPYIKTGIDATHHLCNEQFLASCAKSPIIVNAARGAVIDTPAINNALADGSISAAIIDCWEGEPDIDHTLLDRAIVATPHIAGYSSEGKIRASHTALRAVAKALNLGEPMFDEPDPEPCPDTVSLRQIMLSYNPAADTAALRHAPNSFERLRNNYLLRSEIH